MLEKISSKLLFSNTRNGLWPVFVLANMIIGCSQTNLQGSDLTQEIEDTTATPLASPTAAPIVPTRTPTPTLPPLEERLQQITNHFKDDVSIAWSPDGSEIAFVSNRISRNIVPSNVFDAIYVASTDGGDEIRMTTGFFTSMSSLHWLPDGTRIAFIGLYDLKVESDPAVYEIHKSIFILDLSEAVYRMVNVQELDPIKIETGEIAVEIPWIDEASWSPDGTQIALISKMNDPKRRKCFSQCESQLYIVNADGTQLRQITDGIFQHKDLAWSPDGEMLAVVSNRNDPDPENCYKPRCKWDLYLIDLEGNVLKELTNDVYSYWGLAWSPDGRYLAFNSTLPDPAPETCESNCMWGISFLDLETGNVIYLTDHENTYFVDSWSPDGQYLGIRVYDGMEGSELYTMDMSWLYE